MKILKTTYRRYVAPTAFDATIRFYEVLQQSKCEQRLSFPQMGIEVAVVGAFIVLSGSDDALSPVRHVEAALIVDSLDEFVAELRSLGVSVPSEYHSSSVGRNMTVTHPDGLVVEYFEPATTAAG
jgi:hypothetical protein